MGIPEEDSMDCGVGTIVWLRRRNGSWWPGRILGQRELSATHLMSPRSGTPVKLLGREDASVDWYNLEKSKRVKAFRCGEFDECIRKAELSQGYPPKKREKYARREDAILHALELEKVQMEQNLQKFDAGSNFVRDKRLASMKRDVEHFFPSSSKRNDDTRGLTRYTNIKSQHPRKVGSPTPLNEEYTSTPLAAQKVKQENQLIPEDDNNEIMPRMRGLQDFGLKSASSKKKKSFLFSEGNKRALPSDNFVRVSDFHGVGTVNEINSRRPSSMKRKLLNGVPNKESLVKRCDRRRTLVQVLQSSPKLPMGRSSQSIDPGLAISGSGGSIQMDTLVNSTAESVRPYDDTNCGVYLDKMQTSHSPFAMDNFSLADRLTDEGEADTSDSDSSSHDMDEEATINSDASYEFPSLKSKNFERYGQYSSSAFRANEKPTNMGCDDIEDSGYSRYASRLHHSEHLPVNFVDNVSKWQLKGKRNIRNLNKKHINVPDGCADEDLYQAEEGDRSVLGLSREGFGRYWEESDDCYDSSFYTSELAAEYDGYYHHDEVYKSMLLDVDLKVQASYQGEHVPLVSLMSRLNGKAIIGHPVQVEIMEDVSSDQLLADTSLHDDSSERNGGIPIPHVWRTRRRTVMHRVPRPQQSAHGQSLSKNPWSDTGTSLKKLNVLIGPKNMNHGSHLSMNKLSKKILKNACLSNQKTRMLSSFASEQKTTKNGKQEETTPLVTCIPVKIVFDRLRECLPLRSTCAHKEKSSEEHAGHHNRLGES